MRLQIQQQMNLLTFMKKKSEKPIVTTKPTKEARLDTEATMMAKKNHKPSEIYTAQKVDDSSKVAPKTKVKTEIGEATTSFRVQKQTIFINQLLEVLWALKNTFDQEYDQSLTQNSDQNKNALNKKLLQTDFFRFQKVNYEIINDQYSNVIQSLQLLISKLKNNQKITDKIMLRNEQDFVLFIKFFFSKPYTLINRNGMRKILKILWDKYLFPSLTIPKMIESIRLWIYGISFPTNPSMNKLHQIVIQNPSEITKYVRHSKNTDIYIGINDSDAIGMTPLMIAATVSSKIAIEKLIKNNVSLHPCPLTFSKTSSNSTYQKTKYNKIVFNKNYGTKERKQFNFFEILKYHKKYDLIADAIYFSSIRSMKLFKNNHNLSEELCSFPNCSFQIDWKEYRGILCFKQLPMDTICVYIKDNCIRIDFHVNSLTKLQKNSRFTLLFKAKPKEKVQAYLISHHLKKIKDLTNQIDIEETKEIFDNIMSYGNIYQESINSYKGIYSVDDKRLSISVEMEYENVLKAELYTFSTVKQYIKQIMKSDLINYEMLQKSQLKSALTQKICIPPKVKSKSAKSSFSLDIDWVDQKLNLKNFKTLLRLMKYVYPSSLFLSKIQKISSIFEDQVLSKSKLSSKLPQKCKLTGDNDFNLQLQIKHLIYHKVDDSFFNCEIRAKEMNYEEQQEQIDISKLQETILVQELYSINASRFLGNSQKMLDLEQSTANEKFADLLCNHFNSQNQSDDEK